LTPLSVLVRLAQRPGPRTRCFRSAVCNQRLCRIPLAPKNHREAALPPTASRDRLLCRRHRDPKNPPAAPSQPCPGGVARFTGPESPVPLLCHSITEVRCRERLTRRRELEASRPATHGHPQTSRSEERQVWSVPRANPPCCRDEPRLWAEVDEIACPSGDTTLRANPSGLVSCASPRGLARQVSHTRSSTGSQLDFRSPAGGPAWHLPSKCESSEANPPRQACSDRSLRVRSARCRA